MQFVLFCSNAVWYIGAAEPNVCPPALILYRTSREVISTSRRLLQKLAGLLHTKGSFHLRGYVLIHL